MIRCLATASVAAVLLSGCGSARTKETHVVPDRWEGVHLTARQARALPREIALLTIPGDPDFSLTGVFLLQYGRHGPVQVSIEESGGYIKEAIAPNGAARILPKP